MAGSKIDKKAKTIDIKANSKNEFFLLHGYTGSPTDFNKLGKYLNKRFNANIKIIRLVGHGEKRENLDSLNYQHFLKCAEKELKKDINKKRKIVIGGISIGSFIALQLSTKYPVKGIINISIPYRYRFLAGIVAFLEPLILKKNWPKPMSEHEREMRKKAFYYDANLRGIKVIKHGKEALNSVLDKVTAPCLIVHVDDEKIFDSIGSKLIKDKISSKISKVTFFKQKGYPNHNPFYTQSHKELYKIIGDFVEENGLFDGR